VCSLTFFLLAYSPASYLTFVHTIHNYLLCVCFLSRLAGRTQNFLLKTLFSQFPIFRGYPFRKKRVRWGRWGARLVGGLPLRYVHIFQKSILYPSSTFTFLPFHLYSSYDCYLLPALPLFPQIQSVHSIFVIITVQITIKVKSNFC